MPSSAILDVAIGIAFVYLFLSLICSVVNEGIAAIFSLRSKNLVAGIDSLLSGSTLEDNRPIVELLYSHGLIRGLYKDPPKEVIAKARAASPIGKLRNQAEALAGKVGALGDQLHIPVLGMVRQWFNVNLPAYIPSQVFATAFTDIISPPDPTRPRNLNDVRQAIARLPEGPTKQALMSLVADTQKDIGEFQQKVEGWFNDSMDRAAGWYKHRAQNILLVIALVITVMLNVDTIKLAQSLWNNPVERQATVDLAQKYVDGKKDMLQNNQELKKQANDLAVLGQQLSFPFGWQNWKGYADTTEQAQEQKQAPPSVIMFWGETAVGWLVTTLALSLGAPFWFDILNKFMVVRSTVKPKEKSATEGSKD
jgi:hypothetical protein